MTTVEKTGNRRLSAEELERFGAEMDAIRQRIVAELGEEDAAYIRGVVAKQRGFEIAGRALFYLPVVGWLPAVACLSISKILDNMEIGHNVMHGQYEWMNDPKLSGKQFEWDTACPADQWRHSHNYMHHTHTNIVGKDRDIGYGVLRMSEEQPWNPYYLGNPLWAALLALFFEYGVALHDLEVERISGGETSLAEKRELLKGIWKKVRRQAAKDYVLFPALSGPLFAFPLAGNATANIVRNLWAFTIIFCGHFPEGTHEFSEEETEDETRGEWYYRQLLGSANLSGGPLFHIMAGNLSFQIEHHLFPDMPSNRLKEIAPKVKAVCEEYGLPYNSGPFLQQWLMVQRAILRYSLPGGEEQPKADPYVAPPVPDAVVPTVDGVDGPLVAFP